MLQNTGSNSSFVAQDLLILKLLAPAPDTKSSFPSVASAQQPYFLCTVLVFVTTNLSEGLGAVLPLAVKHQGLVLEEAATLQPAHALLLIRWLQLLLLLQASCCSQ